VQIRPRERLDQRALGLVCGDDSAPVGSDDPLAAASTLKPDREALDERCAVEGWLDAPHRAALISLCCRSSLTRLASARP